MLSPCPNTPNCVSSQATADSKHYIAPLKLRQHEPQQLWQRLQQYIASEPHWQMLELKENFCRAQYKTAVLGFIDLLEFELDPQANLLHWRSASTLGYYDFGQNRRRLEQLRRHLRT